jgi:hypothetical protein
MNVGNYTQSILSAFDATGLFGGGISMLTQAAQVFKGGLGTMVLGLKSFRLALIGTGIGAVIVALGSLIAYFTQTQQGVDLVNRALTSVSTAFAVLRDRLSNIGGLIVDLISGNKSFAETIAGIKEQTKGVVDEMKEEIAIMDELQKRKNLLRDTNNALIVTYAHLETRIAKSRRDANNENLSIRKQQAAMQETIRLTRLMNDIKIKQAIENERIAVEEGKTNINKTEADKIIQEAIAARMRLQAQADDQERSLLRRMNTLNKARQQELQFAARDAFDIKPMQIKNTDKLSTSTEKSTLALDGQNKMYEKLNSNEKTREEHLKDEIELNAMLKNSYEQTTAAIIQGFDQRADAYKRTIENELTRTAQSIEIQTRLAEAGLENQLEQEQKRQAELELKKERAAQADIRREKVKAYYAAFTQELQKGEGPQAATKALAQIAIADGISRLITGSFYEGTESTGRVNNAIDSKGGRLAILHDDERVLTKRHNEAIRSALGNISNDALVQLVTRANAKEYSISTPIVNVNQELQEIHWNSLDERIERKINKSKRETIKHVNSKRPRLW